MISSEKIDYLMETAPPVVKAVHAFQEENKLTLGMIISHKKSLITTFGHKHKI